MLSNSENHPTQGLTRTRVGDHESKVFGKFLKEGGHCAIKLRNCHRGKHWEALFCPSPRGTQPWSEIPQGILAFPLYNQESPGAQEIK